MHIHEKISEIFGESYSLLDSGNFEKLEKFGDKIILRPSSLCLWRKSLSKNEWKNADAVYDPKKGWQFNDKPFNEWIMSCNGFKLKLRPQTNGQVGIFPEHAYYLGHIRKYLSGLNKEPAVLNLFAYSGMASMYCLSQGASVCHVDSSKKALEWAKENSKLNGFDENKLRVIADDALGFIKRENRRGNKYDIVILDPPSFSRLDGNKTWKLEDVLYEFTDGAASLMSDNALLVFSCHHHALDSRVLKNVFFETNLKVVESTDLCITEELNKRQIPAGINITLSNK